VFLFLHCPFLPPPRPFFFSFFYPPPLQSGDQTRAGKHRRSRAQLHGTEQGLRRGRGQRLFCRRARIWRFPCAGPMGRREKNGSGVAEDQEKGVFTRARSSLGRGGFLPPTIRVDKRREAPWKRGGNRADLLCSLFPTKKSTNCCRGR